MKITMIKKILKDGSPCRKCAEVLNQLEENNLLDQIDQIVIADNLIVNSDTLIESVKMRRGVEPGLVPGLPHHRLDHDRR